MWDVNPFSHRTIKRLTISAQCKRKFQGSSVPNANQDTSTQLTCSRSVQNVVLSDQLKEGHAGSRYIMMKRKENMQWMKEQKLKLTVMVIQCRFSTVINNSLSF